MPEPEPHFPYVRPLRLGWAQAEDGSWHHASEDHHKWEVVCAQCGDTDGPANRQHEPAKTLRGPYDSKHAAHRAVKHHSRQHPPEKLEPGPMSDWPVI